MISIYETDNFLVQIPDAPFVDRNEGGHVRIQSKLKVTDRTKLTLEQAIEYTLLSMLAGECLVSTLAIQGIDVGIVNYQEMGNWSVIKPNGPVLHMHIFGRAKTAIKQKYGEAVLLPRRDTGFYDGFESLNEGDITLFQKNINMLVAIDKYQSLKGFVPAK